MIWWPVLYGRQRTHQERNYPIISWIAKQSDVIGPDAELSIREGLKNNTKDPFVYFYVIPKKSTKLDHQAAKPDLLAPVVTV